MDRKIGTTILELQAFDYQDLMDQVRVFIIQQIVAAKNSISNHHKHQ